VARADGHASCTLFWKAIGIVVLALAVWNVGKFALWATKVCNPRCSTACAR
jgi:hypothetical protein